MGDRRACRARGYRVVISPQEYLDFARECIAWAEQTTDENHRAVYLDMAKQWMTAALQQAESMNGEGLGHSGLAEH